MIVKYTQPKRWASWPILTIKFWVITVTPTGAMLLPTLWDADSIRLLSVLAARKVRFFLDSAEHPIRSDFNLNPRPASSQIVTAQNNPIVQPLLLLQQ